jgi:hypothetical protein
MKRSSTKRKKALTCRPEHLDRFIERNNAMKVHSIPFTGRIERETL